MGDDPPFRPAQIFTQLCEVSGLTVIGITGPTGAGKTTVLRVLARLGAVILDCDAVYHDLTLTCVPMREELAARFGADIFDAGGELRRKALGAIVFDDPAALADLNAITHRYIRQALEEEIRRAREEDRPAVALDAIALLESGLGDLCQETVAVTAGEDTRVKRIMARDGIGEEYARLRVAAQKPSSYFEERCGHVLRNDGDDPTQVEEQALALFQRILP